MVNSFFLPVGLIPSTERLKRGRKAGGRRASCPDPGPRRVEFEKISPACQLNSPQARIADSSSTNAVNFSSARTTKRFPSRCASTVNIVCPLEFTPDTQPQLRPALLRLSAVLLIVVDHLRRRFARFKLGAHLLDLGRLFLHRCCEGRHSRFKLCDCLFLHFDLAPGNPKAGPTKPDNTQTGHIEIR
jgi:hypothetical protein